MWKQVKANSNLIQTETERAVLIKLPKSEFTFWHPKKLSRLNGKNNYLLSISYTNDFKFKIFRTGKNFNVLDEKEITVSEFEAFFGVI